MLAQAQLAARTAWATAAQATRRIAGLPAPLFVEVDPARAAKLQEQWAPADAPDANDPQLGDQYQRSGFDLGASACALPPHALASTASLFERGGVGPVRSATSTTASAKARSAETPSGDPVTGLRTTGPGRTPEGETDESF